MANMLDYLKIVLLVQAFFAVSITMITHAVPVDTLNYIDVFTSSSTSSSTYLQEVSTKMQDSLTSQQNIPIIEFGAVVFYSGIIVLDLLMNFLFAVPEMMTLLMSGISLIINLDSFLVRQLQLFIGVAFSIVYIIGVIQLITSMRSGTSL